MAIRIVQSKLNGRVKELRGALRSPARLTSTDPVGVEGIHLLTEALRSGVEMRTVFVAQGHESELDQLGLKDSIEILAMPREILDSAASTETPQPIAALAQPRAWRWANLLSPSPALLVVLAGIQDPGNLGAILRSAEAFGATGVVSLPGTVSPWNPKAMRASAGSVFRLPLISASELDCFDRLRLAGAQTLAAMAHEAKPLGDSDLSSPVALVIGAEGSGLAPELAAQCDGRITIPCPGPVESLNASVAASILLYEASRQRALPSKRRQP